MNNIYNVFSQIKASDELKNRTYQKIIEMNNNKTSKRKFNFIILYKSLAVASIIICLFLYGFHNISTNLSHKNSDIITYKNHQYILDNSTIIDEDMLDQMLDIISDNSSDETFSIASSNLTIYSIKNINADEKIALLKDGKILVYKKKWHIDKKNRKR